MVTQLHRPQRWALVPLAALLLVAAVAGRAEATGPPCAPDANESPYQLHLQALTAAGEGELAVDVEAVANECAVPEVLKKLHVKVLSAAGEVAGVRNLVDVGSAGGHAEVPLGAVERGERIEVTALVQTPETVRTHVLEARTAVLLRPNLRVDSLSARRQALSGVTFRVDAEVTETNGDVGATATATLFDGITAVGSTEIAVDAGGHGGVGFDVALSALGSHELRVVVTAAVPRDADPADDIASGSVEVTEFELATGNVLVASLAGYGGQFNQHVYADISGPPPNLADMEAKVIALEPQFVRTFFNTTEWQLADRMASFIRTVQLAQTAGAQINITWQGSSPAFAENNMGRFADVLADLLKNRGITSFWVTLFNEPNSTALTPDRYERIYRLLDAALRSRGVRERVHFMGGDLVTGTNQTPWFQHLAANMGDLLEAWSIHVIWEYWDTPKIERRLLTEVRSIYDALPAEQRKPLYVTEFSVRGSRTFNGVSNLPQPGVWEDGTPMAQTNISAFQHAWLMVRAAQLGYLAALKWDLFNAKYDNGTQDHSAIGPGRDGWRLRPIYHLIRLMTLTTQPAWSVLAVDRAATGSATKLLTAYAGSGGDLTIVGLDTAGAQLNDVSETGVSYSIGGLTPGTSFRLLSWNGDGTGTNVDGGIVVSNDAGVATISVPLHAVFALTSADVRIG